MNVPENLNSFEAPDALLTEVTELIRDYVVMTPAQRVAVSLWVAHTHALDAFDVSPYLDVTSPVMQCGKTRLFEVLELVVARPWKAILPSEAVVFRRIDKVTPTLLLDECDAIFDKSNGSTEPLRALLNAGNRRGTSVPRCSGPSQNLIDFSVFCAKAFAGIGDVPGTVKDRSIVIRLERRRKNEPVQRFRRREVVERTSKLQERFAQWADQTVLDQLTRARPDIPDGLSDRAEEGWEPLLAIADLAGGEWPKKAREAAIELSGGGSDDLTWAVLLLSDIRKVFAAKGADRLTSAELAEALNGLEESPWGEIQGRALDARSLARRLKHFGVKPRTIRFAGGTAKGYQLDDHLLDVFARYLADPEEDDSDQTAVPESASDAVVQHTSRNSVTSRTAEGIAGFPGASAVSRPESGEAAPANECYGVTVNEPVTTGKVERRAPVEAPPGADEEGYLEDVFDRFQEGLVSEEVWEAAVRAHRAAARAKSPRKERR